ncbi:hypothetical protein [Phocaeicola paurosaccharolyticus]|jgi:DNA replication protein DnaC|uniref:hypothetical protein n=1 Tax=Phocaeicola paurosaccharolyticus TaxID=732242 RepID=UPI001F2FA2A9|nr:hypothetical protein [Phocaeicola paurosaccharolyticus]
MLINNKKPQPNVEALMYRLLHQRSIKERFRLPLSKDDARAALKTAVQAEVQHRHREFITNEAFEKQLDCMAENLTSNNGKFGIALCGYCGNGKTTCVKALQQLINALQIHDSYDNSTYGLRIMTANEIAWKNKNDFSSWERIKTIPLLAIDDLGTEPREILDYGNVLNPIVDLLTKRYDEQLFTIFTTNLTLVQIREKYGDRIADRLNEMMDIIEFTNPTYRMK